MTLGNSTGALVVGVLVLLGHAGDRTPPSPRQTVPEPPPSAEPAPPREASKPPVSAPLAKSPASRKSGVPPGGAAPGGVAQKESAPMPAKPAAPTESAATADSASRTENAPATNTVPRSATTPAAEPPAASPTPAATLDLGSLEKRLRETTAIGVFTKLSLKNQVDDLLDEFREFHKTHDQSMLTGLRQAYDLLLLKVLSLLQDGDPGLARDIIVARSAVEHPDRSR